MLHLNVTAETPEELKKTLIQLAESLNLTSENVTPLPAPKRSKAKKAEPETTEEAPESFPSAEVALSSAADATDQAPWEDAPMAAVEAPAPTLEEARAALNKLRQAKGNAAVRAILNKHNVSSFTDLPASEYAAVMEEAKV